jgi:CRP-like cAMP-binding protein
MDKFRFSSLLESVPRPSPLPVLTASHSTTHHKPLSLASPIYRPAKKPFPFSPSLKTLKSQPSLTRPLPELPDIYPQWLLDRSDFQSTLSLHTGETDIGRICSKPHKQRDSIENRELCTWCRSCAFFKAFSELTTAEVCSRLSTQYYAPGDALIREGEVGDKMFILIKGRVGIYKKGVVGSLDTIGPANIVGETALEANCLRTATVVAIENVTALQLTKDDYTNIIARQKHKQRSAILGLLKSIPFFGELLSARLEMIAWNMLLMHYDAGQTVYLESQIASGLYFIKEGSVKLMTTVTVTNKCKIPTHFNVKETFVQKKTYELLVKKVNAGDFFGEEELLNGQFRKTRAVCLEPSELLLVRKDVIFDMFSEKERNLIGIAHEKMKSKEELRKELKEKIVSESKMQKAIDEVKGGKGSQQGKISIDRLIRRKEVAKSVNFKMWSDENRSLLKEECFFERGN